MDSEQMQRPIDGAVQLHGSQEGTPVQQQQHGQTCQQVFAANASMDGARALGSLSAAPVGPRNPRAHLSSLARAHAHYPTQVAHRVTMETHLATAAASSFRSSRWTLALRRSSWRGRRLQRD
jgi:hypothetical protein